MANRTEAQIIQSVIESSPRLSQLNRPIQNRTVLEMYSYYREKAHFQLVNEKKLLNDVDYLSLTYKGRRMIHRRMFKLWKTYQKTTKSLV